MAIQKIDIEQFLELSRQHPVLDVRSPGEFKHAHIPGAHSLPLFTDEERKIVGTAYKQESREKAIKIGLDFFGIKMTKMVEEVEQLVKNQHSTVSNDTPDSPLPTPNSPVILVHCWRGGMRSAGVAWLLDLYGFNIYTLIGGYKKFRNYVLDTFSLPYQFNILGGYTGSGKTELLKSLQQKGAMIVDLEDLANHKGSAFGNINMPPQPGQEMFENLLALQLRHLSRSFDDSLEAPFKGFGGIWLEDESQRIGLVNIPPELWKTMRQSKVYFLDIPFEERLKHIVQEYGQLDAEKVIDAINRISQKLGNLNAKTAILLLNEGKITESFDILLQYYDRHYSKSLYNREGINSLLHTVKCASTGPQNTDGILAHEQRNYSIKGHS